MTKLNFNKYRYKEFGDQLFFLSPDRDWLILAKKDVQDAEGNIDPVRFQAAFDRLKPRKLKKINPKTIRPNFFIFWITHKCNLKCVYCQAGTKKKREEKCIDYSNWYTEETIRQIYEFIFQTASKSQISIEFQGGEPLIAFDIIQKIVLIGEELALKYQRRLTFIATSNFTLLTVKKLKFIQDHRIQLSSSMDGDPEIHNQLRPFVNGKATFERIIENREQYFDYTGRYPGNLSVITQKHIGKEKELLDFYRSIQVSQIAINKAHNLGDAEKNWQSINLTNQEYFQFWKNLANHIFNLHLEGKFIIDRHLELILKKLYDDDRSYLCWRKPCGAIRGMLCFDGNGNIFPCNKTTDLLTLKLGTVFENTYETLYTGSVCKQVLKTADKKFKTCQTCVYEPICGICLIDLYDKDKEKFEGINFENQTACGYYKKMFDFVIDKIIQEPHKIKAALYVLEQFKCI